MGSFVFCLGFVLVGFVASSSQFRDCHSCYDERSIDQKKRTICGLKIATAFCSTALEAFAGRQYGELEHLEEMENPRFASMYFQNIHHIGDTKSGQELEVFLTMPLERLRLGCGIQCTERWLLKECCCTAEHLVALQLLQEVQQLMGRLVGYYEQRRKGSGTPLDLPVENRNHHIPQKSLLIGCGGGFLQECGQPYSPVSDWIKQVDLVLEDEGQQCGNMEEAATIARTPRTCFEICPVRQTPGGLQLTEEAKKFLPQTAQAAVGVAVPYAIHPATWARRCRCPLPGRSS